MQDTLSLSFGMHAFGAMQHGNEWRWVNGGGAKRRNARGVGLAGSTLPCRPLPNRGNGSACVAKLISVCVVVASTSRQADTHSHCQRDSSPGCQLWLARHFRLLMVRVVSVEHVQYSPRNDGASHGRYVPAHMPLIYVRSTHTYTRHQRYVVRTCSMLLSTF